MVHKFATTLFAHFHIGIAENAVVKPFLVLKNGQNRGQLINSGEKLDGNYLLRTSDDTLSAEDVALGYKQLLLVEDAFRTLKSRLELRPVYHRLEDRIRAHVLLCWLALLLIRIAENRTGQTWCNLRATLQRMHLGEFSGTAGQVRQRTEITPAQKQIFKALAVKEPPRLFSINPAVKKDA